MTLRLKYFSIQPLDKGYNLIKKTVELHTIVNSLTYSHLGHAIDLMRRSYDLKKTSKDGWESMSAHQNAMSSIMHGFCFLESLLNFLGNELLFNKDSSQYILEENRDYLLKKLVSNWSTARALDKLDFLLERLYNNVVEPKYKNKLIEINNLRNILMHGLSYTTILLLESTGDDSWNVHDKEDSIDWVKKFNQNKFNSPKDLTYKDAQKVLIVILEVCKPFYSKPPLALGISLSYPKGNFKVFHGESIDFTDLLKLPAVEDNKTLG